MRFMYWTEPLQLADENLETILSVPISCECHCWLPALCLPWTGQMRWTASVYFDPSWIILRGAASPIKDQIFESYATLSFRFVPFQYVVCFFNITYYSSIHVWGYSPFWSLASHQERLHSSLSLARLFHPRIVVLIMHPSGQRSPILFLVFPPTLCCGIPH